MTVWLMVLVLNGTPTTAPQTFATEAACKAAGASWVAASAQLRGIARGDFACFPAQVTKP